MEKYISKISILLRIGYGIVFLATNLIIIIWADLAASIMKVLETEKKITTSISVLVIFLIISIIIYNILLFINNKLISAFEKEYISIQRKYIHQELMKNGKSKKYSELELINRVTDDLRKIIEWFSKTKTELFLSVLLLLFTFFYLSYYSLLLSVIIYGLMLANLIVPVLYNKHMVADYSQVMQANDNWARRLQEGIENYSGIKYLGAEEDYNKVYKGEIDNFIKAVKIANRTAHTETGLKSGMSQFANYIGYAMAGLFVILGMIDMAMVTRTVLLIPLIQNILSILLEKYVERRNVIVSKQRLNELVTNKKNGSEIPKSCDILLKHVGFSYDNCQLFSDMNYSIKSGQTILIKGENGTGKSTLLKLLTGFYEIQNGEISIGGTNSADIDEDWVASNIFYLPQDNLFIPGTVEENMKLRGINYNPQGFSNLSQNILELSEGQKKQIVLAELFQTGKKILLLDEPENHLDSATLEELVSFLKNDRRTIIIVTHIELFDLIADKIWKLNK